jgi:hypothetical protein
MTTLEQDRIRRAAFNITGAFEGGRGYANYQTYDDGIISYGRFQFTLAAGSMGKVVNYYLASSTSDTANQLRAYQSRIQARDASLRNDAALKTLMVAAAEEQVMKDAQDRVVIESYYSPSQESVTARGITTPLGQALLFDMAIQHGPAHKHTQTAEARLGVAPKSKLGENGLTEVQLITEVAKVRQEFLYGFAERTGLNGVKKRADFWVNLIAAGDWQLQGDANGNVVVYSSPVQVRNPDGVLTSGQPAPQPVAPQPVAPLPAPANAPAANAGEPAGGRFVTRGVLMVYETPSTSGVLMGRVMPGKQLTVQRRYRASATEEWFLTDAGGWVPLMLPAQPGVTLGDYTP